MSENSIPVNPTPEQDSGVLFPVNGFRYKDLPWIVPMALVAASRIAPYVSNLDPRGILPEPIDVPNHIGNTAVTFVLMDKVANGFWGKQPEAMTPDEYESSRKKLAYTVGVLTVAANIFAETVGYGRTSTPDKLDFVYGLLGGVLAYKAKKPHYVAPGAVDRVLSSANSEDPFKLAIQKALSEKQQKQFSQGKKTQKTRTNSGSPIKPNPHSSVKRNKSKNKMQKKSRQNNRKK